MENSKHTIRNRTHDLPVCSQVPQATAPLHAPTFEFANRKCLFNAYYDVRTRYVQADTRSHVYGLARYDAVHFNRQVQS
jgi:hypothetical protein